MAIYAKIGHITGSVSTQGYKGCIDIHSYNVEHELMSKVVYLSTENLKRPC